MEIDSLATLTNLQNLYLPIHVNNNVNVSLYTLSSLVKLKRLNLQVIHALKRDNTFNINGPDINIAFDLQPLATLSSLIELEIRCDFESMNFGLKGVYDNLEILKIARLGFGPRAPTTFPNLHTLSLSFTSQLSNLKVFKNCKILKRLSLNSCHDLTSIYDLQGLPELESLLLYNCLSIENYSPIAYLKNLVVLDIKHYSA
eukprot:Awhi_evm1s1944